VLLGVAADPGLNILALFDAVQSPSMTPEERDALLERLFNDGLDFEPLPLYDLMLFADTATGEQHVTYMALVYQNVEDAEIAAEVIPERLNTYNSMRTRRLFGEMLEERLQNDITTSVVTTEDGPAVMVLRMGTPQGTLEEIVMRTDLTTNSPEMDITFPGAGFRLFMDMLFSRDTGWLSVLTPEALQEQLED